MVTLRDFVLGLERQNLKTLKSENNLHSSRETHTKKKHNNIHTAQDLRKR